MKRPKQDPDFNGKSAQSPAGHGHSKWQDNMPSPQLHTHHDPYEFSDEPSSNAGSFRKRAFRNSRDDSFTRTSSFTSKVSCLVSSFLSFLIRHQCHCFLQFCPVCSYVVLSQPSHLHPLLHTSFHCGTGLPLLFAAMSTLFPTSVPRFSVIFSHNNQNSVYLVCGYIQVQYTSNMNTGKIISHIYIYI